MKNYYDILEVERGSSQEEIKTAYRRLAVKYHPDKNNGQYTEQFNDIIEAQKVLLNHLKKLEYDYKLNNLLEKSQSSITGKKKLKKHFVEDSALRKGGLKYKLAIVFSAVLFIAFVVAFLQSENQNKSSRQLVNRPTVASISTTVGSNEIRSESPTHYINQPTTSVKSINKLATVKKQISPKKIPLIKKATTKVETSKLTQQKSLVIIQKIVSSLKSSGQKLKCIQIRKTKDCNLKNAFAIANSLKAKGYIITGRQIISQKQNGYSLENTEGCFKLTLGVFQ